MLVKYFSEFPLLGKNSQNYKQWYEVYKNKTEINLSPSGRASKKIDNNLNLSYKRGFSTSSFQKDDFLTGDLKLKKYNVPLNTCTELVV
jgi:hypothetical protein